MRSIVALLICAVAVPAFAEPPKPLSRDYLKSCLESRRNIELRELGRQEQLLTTGIEDANRAAAKAAAAKAPKKKAKVLKNYEPPARRERPVSEINAYGKVWTIDIPIVPEDLPKARETLAAIKAKIQKLKTEGLQIPDLDISEKELGVGRMVEYQVNQYGESVRHEVKKLIVIEKSRFWDDEAVVVETPFGRKLWVDIDAKELKVGDTIDVRSEVESIGFASGKQTIRFFER